MDVVARVKLNSEDWDGDKVGMLERERRWSVRESHVRHFKKRMKIDKRNMDVGRAEELYSTAQHSAAHCQKN